MKRLHKYLVAGLIVLLSGIFSCQDPNSATDVTTITVSGQVVNSKGGLDSVIVQLSDPFRRDTTKSDGSFNYTFTTSEKTEVTASVKFSRRLFKDSSINKSYSSTKKTLAFGEVQLTAIPGLGGDSIAPKINSLKPGVIVYRGSSVPSISIKGSGGNETTNLTFEVRDSIGTPIDERNAVYVRFKIVNRPDTVTLLNLDSVKTASNGQAVVQLSAGQRAGIVQVEASARVKRSSDTTKFDIIKSSSAAAIPIFGGLPDSSHFSIGSDKLNIPGAVKFNERATISVIVGDKFGNPVQPQTPVYFTTTGGSIIAAGATSPDGIVSTQLISGNPFPRNGGFVNVTAQIAAGNFSTRSVKTIDAAIDNEAQEIVIEGPIGKRLKNKKVESQENQSVTSNTNEAQEVTPAFSSNRRPKYNTQPKEPVYTPLSIFSKTISILFSGPTQIYSADSTFFVSGLKEKRVDFIVSDPNGNPLSGGTTIKVTGTGLDTTGAVLSGDIEKTIVDTYDRAYTQYSILISDRRTKNLNQNRPFSITVEVNSSNGNLKKTFSGTLLSAFSDSGKVGSIALVNTTIDTIVVNGGGSPISSPIQARVLDVFGKPSKDVTVNFQLTRIVNGGEYLSKLVSLSDANGVATTTLNSGIRSGIVQIVASVKRDTVSLSTDTKTFYIKTGTIASLSVVNISSTNLSVKGGGGIENSTIVMEARDSLGNPIDLANQVSVFFSIAGEPGATIAKGVRKSFENSVGLGLENQEAISVSIAGDTSGSKVNPSVVKTDPSNGRVTTNFSSGTRAGIVQVNVSAGGGTVKAAPIQFTISGGLPSPNRFSLNSIKKNFSILTEKTTVFTVLVGDKNGNPVKLGTPIYFTSNGGIIDASAATNISGVAAVTLQIGNPQPPAGIATIEAKAIGENGTAVRDTVAIIFSREAQISEINGPYANFTIDNGSNKLFQFRVGDINGNPLAQGTSIKVEASGAGASQIVLTGDINIASLPDTKFQGTGTTEFSFTATDTVKSDIQGPKALSFKITVSGPNTTAPISKTFDGILKSGTGPGNEGIVSSIKLVSSTADTISVAGVGGSITTDTLTFVARDVNNKAVKDVTVQFLLTKDLKSSEFLSPSTGVTNDSGRVVVVVNSGVKAGLLQVAARVTSGGNTINSASVDVRVKTGSIASIFLVNIDNPELSVKGAGGIEVANIVVEARDVLGNPIDGANQTTINFTVAGDTAGTKLTPVSQKTDFQTGRATTTFTSGTRSGSVQLLASAIVGAIKTAPMQLRIAGGLPSQNQFTISTPKKNLSFVAGGTAGVTVVAGDKYGNPAKIGTVINFSTTGGLITASGVTDASGATSATLQLVNPFPPSGIATIGARTFGENGVIVKDSLTIVFSREAAITEIAGPYAGFTIDDGSSKTFQFKVADANGNPLAQGTTITVQAVDAAASAIQLSGDINVNIQDTKFIGVGTTDFSFTARDTVKGEGQGPKKLGFKISVNGPNSGGGILHSINGQLIGGTGPGTEGSVASVTLLSSTNDTIVVANGGTPTSTVLKYVVRDLLVKPVKGATVQFVKTLGMDASEFLSPTSIVSDDSGWVNVTVNSGLKNGLIQIEARIVAGATTISSSPKRILVKTGPLATLSLVSINNKELSVKGVGGIDNATIIFEAKDALGNILDQLNQTKIYFQILGGSGGGEVVKPDSGVTDIATGRVQTTLTSGTSASVIQVLARNSSGLIKSSPVAVTISGGFAVDSLFFISGLDSSYFVGNRTVNVTTIAGDRYGNPIKDGTAIYYTTDAGIISASGTTTSGRAPTALQLISDNRFIGRRYITARTVGDNGANISKTANFFISGTPAISLTNVTNDTLIISDGGTSTVNFTIADASGNPIPLGNDILVANNTVAAITDIELSGDVATKTRNTQNKTTGIKYSFSVRDKNSGAGFSGMMSFTISVAGVTKTFYGFVQGSGGSTPGSGNVASVRYVTSSSDTIVVANGGTPTRDTLTFIVKDVSENPVKNVTVQFSFSTALNASEYLFPSSAVTDSLGKVKVVLNSGVKAGLVKVIASVTANSTTIVSLPVTVLVKTGPLANIALISVNENQLSVKGVGGIENSTIVFEGRDALGNALDGINQTKLYFSIAGGPGSGEQIKPDSGLTDPFSGRISATLTSGTAATVLQAIARNATSSVKSSPVPIVVTGGFPVDSLMSFIGFTRNYSIFDNAPNNIQVNLGDSYGNPVKTGTAVYFTTNAGIIKGAGFTDNFGSVITQLTIGNDPNILGSRRVTAKTVGANGANISKSVNILLTGSPIINILNVATDTVKIFDGSLFTVNYRVADALGNPMVKRTLINVKFGSESAMNQLDLNGDIDLSTLDTTNTNATNFSFTIFDKVTGTGTDAVGSIKITVTDIKGNIYQRKFYIRTYSPQSISVPPSARKAAQIAFISTTATDIFVSGVGALENATLSYEVRDSLGIPINSDNRVSANFTLTFSPNRYSGGGTSPTILPTVDSTDDQGKLRVAVLSGTQAGTLQLTVTVNLTNPVRTLKSQPVKITVSSGFADQAHFTLAPENYNFSGLEKPFIRDKITVQVVDKYSNPVKEGTAVYFNTANGSIQTIKSLTDVDGFIKQDLISSNPLPDSSIRLASGLTKGYSRVYANTIGQGGVIVSDSALLLWTGKPIIAKTSGAATYTVIHGSSGPAYSFTVMDKFDHPMSAGTIISVSGDGLSIGGQAGTVMTDTQVGGSGITDFSITTKDANSVSHEAVPSILLVTVIHPVYGRFTYILATGTVN